jgi:multidrug efflux pump subunit AcrB
MSVFTRFSLKNPVVIFILVVLLAIGGIISSLTLKEELLPSFSVPDLAILTAYPGAGPKAVLDDVTEPLEKALRGVQGVKTVLSTSQQSVSQIELQLSSSADVSTVQQKVQQTLNQVSLPSSAGTPTLIQESLSSAPVLFVTVAAKNRAQEDALKRFVRASLVPALQGVSGVAEVTTAGAEPPQVKIVFNAHELAVHHLTMSGVLEDLAADNTSRPVGIARVRGLDQPVQVSGQLTTLADIRNLALPITPSQTAAFKPIGNALTDIGSAVGKLGKGEGQLGQGVAQLGEGVGLLQLQNRLLVGLTTVQGDLFGAELELARLAASPPSATTRAQAAKLTGLVTSLRTAQSKLLGQLNALQAKTASLRQPPLAQAPADSAPDTGAALPALPSTSGSPSATTLATVQLRDVAQVSLAAPTDVAINRTDGRSSILLAITKTDSSNTVQLIAAVKKQLASTLATFAHPLQETTLYDASGLIVSSIDGLLREAVLGAIFAALVILLFLRNLRTTVIAVVSIPISLLIALILINRFGISLNIMTLGGMAVATGRVVDDSIVVTENIFRVWRRGYGYGRRLALFATREVANAITTSTLTTIAVFLPLGFVGGVVGKIFAPFALTVVFALVSSLFVALTVVPTLSYLLVVRRDARAERAAPVVDDADSEEQSEARKEGVVDESLAAQINAHDEQAPLRPWQLSYRRFLQRCLDHKAPTIIVTLLLLVAAVAVLPTVGSTFLPESSQKSATISVNMPIGTPLAVTAAKAKQVERIVLSHKQEVTGENVQIGSDPGSYNATGGLNGTNQASFFLELSSHTHVTPFAQDLQKQLNDVAGPAKIQVQTLSAVGSTNSLDLIVKGGGYPAIAQAANRITDSLRHMPGLADVQNNLAKFQPTIHVRPLPAKLTPYGLTSYQLAQDAQDYLSTQTVGTVTLGGTSYDVVATMRPSSTPVSIAGLRSLPIQAETGQTITLGDVATVVETRTPVSILHRDGHRYAEVTATFTTKNTGAATKQALSRIKALNLPAAVHVSLSGTSQEQTKDFTELIEAVLGSAGIVYIVMLVAFGEWTAPFAILFSMPVALIGAFFATVIARQPVSISSLIGILMLMGIVVTNAIVLVDRVEKQRHRGLSVRAALLEAGTTRLRPIVMTAVATICALAPLAAGLSEGVLISQGLAVVVIGGLVTSTVLTLVIVPLVYELLHLKLHRRQQRRELTVGSTAG